MSQQQELQNLQEREKYTDFQQNLAFEKELNILRNDFYYQMIESKEISLVDFMYRPLDVLSGDAYSARRIDEHRTLYLLVDGMGKGISASLTTITFTAFVNHILDKMIEFESFSLEILIREAMGFIQPILLEEEVLAVDFIYFNSYMQELEYAKFAMPPFLLQDYDDKVHKIKSNNLPLSKWLDDFKVDRLSVAKIDKFLFYSDGIVENCVDKANKISYAHYIEEDFKASFTKGEFVDKFFSRISKQEDDLSLIFINSLELREKTLLQRCSFETSLDAVEKANLWYEEILQDFGFDIKKSAKIAVVFNELIMNAYEHGNLAVDNRLKHRYLEEDIYIEKLQELEQLSDKEIYVEIYKIDQQNDSYLITKICDEGEGFDTQLLQKIFRNSKKFNGRGVFVSRKNSMGIYYNPKGNCVLFLNKL